MAGVRGEQSAANEAQFGGKFTTNTDSQRAVSARLAKIAQQSGLDLTFTKVDDHVFEISAPPGAQLPALLQKLAVNISGHNAGRDRAED